MYFYFVIFDFDGILFDIVVDFVEVCCLMLVEIGELLCSQVEVYSFVGKGMVVLVECCLIYDQLFLVECLYIVIEFFKCYYVVVNG